MMRFTQTATVTCSKKGCGKKAGVLLKLQIGADMVVKMGGLARLPEGWGAWRFLPGLLTQRPEAAYVGCPEHFDPKELVILDAEEDPRPPIDFDDLEG